MSIISDTYNSLYSDVELLKNNLTFGFLRETSLVTLFTLILLYILDTKNTFQMYY